MVVCSVCKECGEVIAKDQTTNHYASHNYDAPHYVGMETGENKSFVVVVDNAVNGRVAGKDGWASYIVSEPSPLDA